MKGVIREEKKQNRKEEGKENRNSKSHRSKRGKPKKEREKKKEQQYRGVGGKRQKENKTKNYKRDNLALVNLSCQAQQESVQINPLIRIYCDNLPRIFEAAIPAEVTHLKKRLK